MSPSDQRNRRVLLACAAPKEADAIARGLGCGGFGGFPLWAAVEIAPGVELVRTGVGPAAAAGGVARALDKEMYRVVLSLGIAGALPGEATPGLESVLLATRSVYGDLGIQTPGEFISIDQMGFATTGTRDSFGPDSSLAARLRPLADATGPVATVSVCSGTDAHARAIRERIGSLDQPAAEGMEGASVGLVAEVMGVGFAEIRVISNTTGDRASQRWALAGALDRLVGLANALGKADV